MFQSYIIVKVINLPRFWRYLHTCSMTEANDGFGCRRVEAKTPKLLLMPSKKLNLFLNLCKLTFLENFMHLNHFFIRILKFPLMLMKIEMHFMQKQSNTQLSEEEVINSFANIFMLFFSISQMFSNSINKCLEIVCCLSLGFPWKLTGIASLIYSTTTFYRRVHAQIKMTSMLLLFEAFAVQFILMSMAGNRLMKENIKRSYPSRYATRSLLLNITFKQVPLETI